MTEYASPDEREEAIMLLTFAVRELTSELARFRRFSEQADQVSVPAIRYVDTMQPPPMPEARTRSTTSSWHERIRQKHVSLPVAGVSGAIGYIVIEVLRALFDGRLRFW